MKEDIDTSTPSTVWLDSIYISVMIDIKELAERKRIRELNRRLERLQNGSS